MKIKFSFLFWLMVFCLSSLISTGKTVFADGAYNQRGSNSPGIFNDIITKGPWVDIRSIPNMKCDGITNDTSTLQAYLNTLTSAVQIYVTNVTCVINAITLPASGKIHITGNGLSSQLMGPNLQINFNGVGVDNVCEIDHLFLNNTGTTTTGVISFIGPLNLVSIHHNRITGGLNNIYIDGNLSVAELRIWDNEFFGFSGDSVLLTNTAGSNKFGQLHFERNRVNGQGVVGASAGLRIQGYAPTGIYPEQIISKGNTYESSVNGIKIEMAEHFSSVDDTFESHTGDQINIVKQSGLATSAVRNFQIINDHFRGKSTSPYSIHIVGASTAEEGILANNTSGNHTLGFLNVDTLDGWDNGFILSANKVTDAVVFAGSTFSNLGRVSMMDTYLDPTLYLVYDPASNNGVFIGSNRTNVSGKVTASQGVFNVAIGTPPLSIVSTTPVPNLTVQNLDQPLFTAQTFATLGAPVNGTVKYCSDCTIANPCAGAGTGAFAKRLNGIWVCN